MKKEIKNEITVQELPEMIFDFNLNIEQVKPLDMRRFPELAIVNVLVDHNMARELLSVNKGNRQLVPNVVKTYVQDMLDKNWFQTCDTIKIDKDGYLRDGQHRLTAIVLSQQSQVLTIAYGIDPDSFVAIDTGRGRTGRDIFSLEGEENVVLLAATCRWHYLFHNDLLLHKNWRSPKITNFKLQQTLINNPELRESVKFVSNNTGLRQLFSPSMMAFCHFLFTKIDAAASGDFFESLDSGANLLPDSPILKLRYRFFTNRVQRYKKDDAPTMLAFTIKTWNAFRRGESKNKLIWTKNSKMPMPI